MSVDPDVCVIYSFLMSTDINSFVCDDRMITNNNISGKIPVELKNLSELVFLDLSHNNLSGSIPNALANLKNLQSL